MLVHMRVGQIYRNRNGSDYLCLEDNNGSAVLERCSDKWMLIAHGVCFYADGTIEWDYSTGGHWVN